MQQISSGYNRADSFGVASGGPVRWEPSWRIRH
jgi:hypothetical protein